MLTRQDAYAIVVQIPSLRAASCPPQTVRIGGRMRGVMHRVPVTHYADYPVSGDSTTRVGLTPARISVWDSFTTRNGAS